MSDVRTKIDRGSGILLVEKDFNLSADHLIKVTVTFKPVGLWRKILCWVGLDYPGPVLMEIETGGKVSVVSSKRLRKRTEVTEQIFAPGKEGKGMLRALLNPNEFSRTWKVDIEIDGAYN